MARRVRRRRTGRHRIGLIVEGTCEREAFKTLGERLPHRPLLDIAKTTRSDLGGLGGSMTPAAIARKVVPRVLVLAPDNDKVLVCLDREGRHTSAAAFGNAVARALVAEFKSRGVSAGVPVEVVVADRAFEAWILADINGLRAKRGMRALRKRCYEGFSERGDFGARLIRKALGRYEKAEDGARYFAHVDLARGRVDCVSGRGWGSTSLDRFLQELGA